MRQETLQSETSFFPTPLQDELLDSFVYRYHHLSGNSTPGVTLKQLFGSFSGWSPRMLVSRVDYLYGQLPSNLFVDVDDLLNKHCLLPAFNRIYDGAMMSRLRLASYGGGMGMGIAYRYCRHPRLINESLQCCPVCVQSDIEDLGITYWRRSHQLNGATVCFAHGCDLMEACPYCRQKLCKPANMDLPTSFCSSCGKKFVPIYSYARPVQKLAWLAHDALASTAVATDLLQLAKVVLVAADHNTYAVCQAAERFYGKNYLFTVQTKHFANDPDWLQDSFAARSKIEESGPQLLNFRTFAELLMTVDILFGSWKNLDRAMGLYVKVD